MASLIARTSTPCMKRAKRKIIPKGVRNELARQYACACFKDDIPKQRALSILAKDFYHHCERSDDFSYEEVERCFKWVYAREEKEVFVNCNIIAKTGWCKEDDKKICELYHYRKIYKSQKKIIKYMKEKTAYKHDWSFVSFKRVKEIAGEHQKTILRILFDDLGGERPTHGNDEPADYVFLNKEQINKLEKNMNEYAEIYARKMVKEDPNQPWVPPKPRKKLWTTEDTRKEQPKKPQQKRAVKPIKREAARPQKKVAIEKPKNRGGRPKKEIDKQKLFQLRKEGKSIREIAREFNVSPAFVSKKLKEHKEKE